MWYRVYVTMQFSLRSHITIRNLLLVGAPIATYLFFANVSPYASDGTLIKENILLGSILLGTTLYVFFRILFEGVFMLRNANKLAGMIAFTCIELLLIGSLSLLNVWSILAAAIFNIVLYWYLTRRFNKR